MKFAARCDDGTIPVALQSAHDSNVVRRLIAPKPSCVGAERFSAYMCIFILFLCMQ